MDQDKRVQHAESAPNTSRITEEAERENEK